MDIEIGKVIKYDDVVGKIISSSGNYLFLSNELENKINLNDLVIFRPECFNNLKRAFFVSNLKDYLKENKDNKELLKKIKNIYNDF